MEKENRRVQMSKKMLKDGILRLLKQKNASQITITELCRESDVNRATFYRYYQVPEDVIKDIGWDYVKKIQEIFDNYRDRRLEERLTVLFHYLDEERQELKILFSANADHSIAATLSPMFSYAWENYFELETFLASKDTDEFRLITTCYGWAIYYMIRQWIMEDIKKNPEQMTKLLIKSFWSDRQKTPEQA